MIAMMEKEANDYKRGKGISKKSEYVLNPQKVKATPVGEKANGAPHICNIKVVGGGYAKRTGYGTEGV